MLRSLYSSKPSLVHPSDTTLPIRCSISFTLLRKQTRKFRLSDRYLIISLSANTEVFIFECRRTWFKRCSYEWPTMFQSGANIKLSCNSWLTVKPGPRDCLRNNLNTVPNITFRERWATPYGTKCRHEWGRGAAHIGGLHVSNFIRPHSDTRLSFILLPINYSYFFTLKSKGYFAVSVNAPLLYCIRILLLTW